jgi:hypothetical protein
MDTPSYLAWLEALGVNIAGIKDKWLEWATAHPGQSAPVEDIRADLVAQLTPDTIAKAVDLGLQELLDFLKNPEGPITPGDDPSVFA